jgi:hypothetical protein
MKVLILYENSGERWVAENFAMVLSKIGPTLATGTPVPGGIRIQPAFNGTVEAIAVPFEQLAGNVFRKPAPRKPKLPDTRRNLIFPGEDDD